MAFESYASPKLGSGSNLPLNKPASEWLASGENQVVVNSDTWVSQQNTTLLLLPQVYSTPI